MLATVAPALEVLPLNNTNPETDLMPNTNIEHAIVLRHVAPGCAGEPPRRGKTAWGRGV